VAVVDQLIVVADVSGHSLVASAAVAAVMELMMKASGEVD